ncbi:MAG: putative ABC transporter periplasmic-binding protein [Methanosaeta sp. PtaU1.Bin112]|nr:MAG: putative ABC transporter periplasmic-binding protein [Methanosaeta sp. PtaU1.Bin112]
MSRLPILGLAAAGLLLLIICSSPSGATDTVDVLTIADSTGDWGFPSPYAHYSRGPGYVRMSLIFDTLVWKDENGFVPALAESWEYLADEKAYLFHLRSGVTWNDGEPFTAKDVAFTYQYIKDHPYQWVDSSVVENAEATDDRTVKITLQRDYAPFLDQVAGTLPIMPEHIYQDVSDPASFKDPKALTGTGPFKLVNYDKTQGTYLYEAYDGYYQGAPRVKQIKFVKVNSEMAAAALKKGDVDAASVPGETVEDVKKEGFTVVEGSHDWVAKIMINHMKAPFSDPKFRQALYYAIDRQDLVDTGLRGFGLAGSPGLYASDNPWYNPDQEQYNYDPARAGQLLEELGYEKKEGSKYYTKISKPEAIELLVTASTERQGELIKKQLDDAGISVNLRSVDSKTLDSMVGGWQFDLALSGHGGLGGDPAILNKVVLDQQSFNSARYDEDSKLNDLLESQVEEMDPAKRKELVDSAQEVIAQDLPALPLYYTDSYWASNNIVSYYYTYGGVGSGVPIALNKMIFV